MTNGPNQKLNSQKPYVNPLGPVGGHMIKYLGNGLPAWALNASRCVLCKGSLERETQRRYKMKRQSDPFSRGWRQQIKESHICKSWKKMGALLSSIVRTTLPRTGL